MIKIIEKGNIFDSKCEALVNPVNCVGVMGAGLAKEFKIRFKKNFQEYKRMCDLGYYSIGEVFVVSYGDTRTSQKHVINFPTKYHWKDPSKIEFIQKGIKSLEEKIKTKRINSIAVPALGCGLGGLKWEDVLPLIKSLDSDNIEIEVYAPWK